MCISPFLKWAGGKRWLIKRYLDIFPSFSGRYIEPFLGGGSVFFYLTPDCAILNDINTELIDTYIAIRDDWRKVVEILNYHAKNNSSDYYYTIRSSVPESLVERAARFIYLNRTCFNGIYRVNRKGEFNVPYGGNRKNIIFKGDDFEGVSKLLKKAKLKSCDFEEVINDASSGDLIFVDPPYTVKYGSNSFIKYNEKLFSWDDQVRLSNCLKKASERGAFIISTNAHHKSIIELYENEFEIHFVCRKSLISANKKFRGDYEELLIIGKNVVKNNNH